MNGTVADAKAIPFATHATLQNRSGAVIRLENPDNSNGSNVVVFVTAEILTNHPASHLQQRLVPVQNNISTNTAKSVQNLVQDGKLLFEMNKMEEAKSKLQSALALDPDNASARYYLERVQASRGTSGIVLTGAGRQAILHKLETIRLENFSTGEQGLPLNEALKQLSEQIKLHDPEHQGVNFLINNNPDEPGFAPNANGFAGSGIRVNTGLPSPPTSTTNEPADVGSFKIRIAGLSEARLVDLLDALVLTSDHPLKYSIQDFAVVFSAKVPQSEPLFARVFRLDTNSLATFLRTQINSGTNSMAGWMRDLLSQSGVDFQTPPGKSLFYNERLGNLFVKATESDLKIIEQALDTINGTPPQVHIKARFLEVPVGSTADFKELLAVTNSGPSQFTGILNDASLRTLLRSLASREGITNLGEPEVTTLTGRQTQMRATEIITVTNLVARTNTITGAKDFEPETAQIETGPILDVVPYVLADGYTINLAAIPNVTEFEGYAALPGDSKKSGPMPVFSKRQVVTTLNVWDNQTVLIGGLTTKSFGGGQAQASTAPDLSSNKKTTTNELLILITATIVDRAGNRVHSDETIPPAK